MRTPRRQSSLSPKATAIIVIIISVLFVGVTAEETPYLMKISKSLEVYSALYKEVVMNYVDQIDPEKFMNAGIDGMLGSLDPYTSFYDVSDGSEVDLITSGSYGGIGITVGIRDGYITITSLMDGYSAQKQGLLVGDRIIEIEGTSVVGLKPDQLRTLTRGEPGTEVHLMVEREGEPSPLSFILLREEIQLKNISYADHIEPGIGYIRLDRFTRSAGEEVRNAIKDLRLKHDLHGLILDLRDNPGGVLDAAVDIAQKFLPKGSLIVTTRGRRPESERQYIGTEEPMLPSVPLVVLVDGHSASASEVLAGAIQDFDRGVVLGTRSFGKGLVQSVLPMPFGTQLKMTTAKYYTPSGRCIQEVDYMHKDSNGIFAVVPESLRQEFKTAVGRPVYASGGIEPDTVVADPEESALHRELLKNLSYVRFGTRYVTEHKDSVLPRENNRLLLEEFDQYLRATKFSYKEDTESHLEALRDAAVSSRSSGTILSRISELDSLFKVEKLQSVHKFDDQILRALRSEIMSRFKGEAGRIAEQIADDPQVEAARVVLKHLSTYRQLLSPRIEG